MALLSGMDFGSREWQLAMAMVSGMDVAFVEWLVLALTLLSGLDNGSSE